MDHQLPNLVNLSAWQQLLNWILDPLAFQDRCYKKYGDYFTINLSGLGQLVIVSNPQAIQDIFNRNYHSFDIGRGNEIAAPIVGQNSLMLMDGERHKRERKLLMPPFHGERLQTYAQQIVDITRKIINKLKKGDTFKGRSLTQEITLEIIIQVVFGLRTGERYQQIKPLLTDTIDMAGSPLRSSMLFFRFLQQDWGSWSPWGKMQQCRRQIYQILQAEIEERRNHSHQQGTDILSLMMSIKDEENNSLRDQELKDELMTLLFAGHETTATILAWGLYELNRHPKVLEKLTSELASLGEDSSPLAIAKLPYLKAVCQEILRKYPVLPILFPRITKERMKIGDYTFEPETALMPSIYLVHYREDLYPQTHEFKPERFMEASYSPSEYFPFGGGERRCLGYALADLEMKLILATILGNCKLKLTNNKPIKMQRRGFTLAPQGGVPLTVIDKIQL